MNKKDKFIQEDDGLTHMLTKEELDKLYYDTYKFNFYKARYNPTMRRYVQDLNPICAICGTPIMKVEDFIIRPKVKETLCDYINTIKILYSTTSRRNGKRSVPDCAKCYEEHPEKFQECVSLFEVLHSKCNRWFHAKKDKETKEEKDKI